MRKVGFERMCEEGLGVKGRSRDAYELEQIFERVLWRLVNGERCLSLFSFLFRPPFCLYFGPLRSYDCSCSLEGHQLDGCTFFSGSQSVLIMQKKFF